MEDPSMATSLKVCPNCQARALAPFLGPKRRCKACGTYVDVLDLMLEEAGPLSAAPAGPAR
jgi:uncharacterized protein (DUF983 family)